MARGESYEEFVAKFSKDLPKTTDDCLTPPAVFSCVLEWLEEKIGREFEYVRPFYPGGDYEREEYPAGAIVVDNPPFSILSKIIDFYNAKGTPFFLFCDTRTASGLSNRRPFLRCIVAGETVTYLNGAKVNTSFVTNLEEFPPVYVAGTLRKKIEEAQTDPNYCPLYKRNEAMPKNWLSSSRLGKYAKGGQDYGFTPVGYEKKWNGKTIYGNAFVVAPEDMEKLERMRGD